MSGVSTHVNTLFDAALPDVDLRHFRVGREGRRESAPRTGLRLLLSPFHLLLVLLRTGAAVVHVNTSLDRRAFWRDAVYVAVARLLGRAVVLQVHGGELPESFTAARPARAVVLRVLLRVAVSVLLLAEVERRAYTAWSPSTRVEVVPNAVLVPPSPPARDLTSGRPLRLITVGRVVAAKGLFEVVQAVELLRDDGVQVTWSVVGSGTDAQALETDVLARGLQDRVALVGPVFGSDKASLLAEADVLLLPSRSEGLPYVLLEAMAAGVVPVVTPVGAVPDVVRHGLEGLLVDGRPSSIASAVRALDADRRRTTAMGVAARRRVEEHYDLAQLAAVFNRVYAHAGARQGIPR